jgi:hypothetical protein
MSRYGRYDKDDAGAALVAAGFLFLVGCICLALQHHFFPPHPTAHVEVTSEQEGKR